MIPQLETERLILRGWKAEDFDAYAAFHADREVPHLDGSKTPAEVWDRFCSDIGQWSLHDYGMFAIVPKQQSAAVGFAGLWHPIDLNEPELCWSLYRVAQGKGYATEAARAVQDWAHGARKLPPLMSFIHPDNFPSQRVAERLGATLESRGELRGQPRLIYRHRTLATIQSTSKKETETCH